MKAIMTKEEFKPFDILLSIENKEELNLFRAFFGIEIHGGFTEFKNWD